MIQNSFPTPNWQFRKTGRDRAFAPGAPTPGAPTDSIACRRITFGHSMESWLNLPSCTRLSDSTALEPCTLMLKEFRSLGVIPATIQGARSEIQGMRQRSMLTSRDCVLSEYRQEVRSRGPWPKIYHWWIATIRTKIIFYWLIRHGQERADIMIML